MNQLRISLVIPAYNEERHIRTCLESVASQIAPPAEVIVVDNNSSDKTAAIAQEYSFVTLIREPRQGRAHARNAGFNRATGDVIARVDADATLQPDWVAQATHMFTVSPLLGGVSGFAEAALFFTGPWRGTFWSRVYYWASDSYFRLPTLWGANMAVRRSAWSQVAPGLCDDDAQAHEDIDLSLALWAHDWPIVYDPKLIIATNGREYLQWPKLKVYVNLRKQTKQRNVENGVMARASRHYLPMWKTGATAVLMAVPAVIFILVSRTLQATHYRIRSGR